jgi:hypothetical protein
MQRSGPLAFLAFFTLSPAAFANSMNPDISVVGQPAMVWSDASEASIPSLDPGEVEGVFDAALNPYARGTFILALGEEGLELEEGFFRLHRGLPAGLALKAGKYKVGLGRINTTHAHALPFAERFGVMADYLPGEEGFSDVGLSLSELLPLGGDASLTLAADWLQGDAFHAVREEEAELPTDTGSFRPAFAGSLTFSTLLGGRSPLDAGLSAVRGVNDVSAGTATLIADAFVKLRIRAAREDHLDLHGELVWRQQEHPGQEPSRALGGFAYGDYTFRRRFNLGASYEQFQPLDGLAGWNRGAGAFVGFGLMEETTLFALDGRRAFAGPDRDPETTLTLRAIFSMGPHKPHAF